MPDLTLICDSGELFELRSAWAELWRRDTAATSFQSPDWLLPWWNQFGDGELRTILIRRHDELIGILPAYLYTEPDSGIRRLLPIGISTSDYLDGTFAPELPPEDIATGLRLLLDESGWDELTFPQLRPDSRLTGAFRSLGISLHAGEPTSQIPAVPLSELAAKLRRNILNARNRARRLGRLELTHADGDTWPAAFEALRLLHSRRWHQVGGSGVLADPRVLAWHREALPQMLRAGAARLSSLCLDGQILAVLYSLLDPPSRSERKQYCYLIGFSTDYAELSPGTLLLAALLEEAAAEGLTALDLLRGDEPYKSLWHPIPLIPQTAFAQKSAFPGPPSP